MTAISSKEQKDPKPCQLYLGTSGFSYTEWEEAGFYPSGTKSGKMLQQYRGRGFVQGTNDLSRPQLPIF